MAEKKNRKYTVVVMSPCSDRYVQTDMTEDCFQTENWERENSDLRCMFHARAHCQPRYVFLLHQAPKSSLWYLEAFVPESGIEEAQKFCEKIPGIISFPVIFRQHSASHARSAHPIVAKTFVPKPLLEEIGEMVRETAIDENLMNVFMPR